MELKPMELMALIVAAIGLIAVIAGLIHMLSVPRSERTERRRDSGLGIICAGLAFLILAGTQNLVLIAEETQDAQQIAKINAQQTMKE